MGTQLTMICNNIDCSCEEKCCQECADVANCENRCSAVRYKEKIYADPLFLAEELNKLAEEKDNWLIAVAAQRMKDLQAANERAEADCAALLKEFERLLTYESISWLHDHFKDIILKNHPGDKLLERVKVLERAFKLGFTEFAGDSCPYEFNYVDKPECINCTHDCEIRQDTERYLNCWKEYYLAQAKEAANE
jgi:hypothetical protein